MWLMNLRPLQFHSNLMDITQVKEVVNMAKDISAGTEMNEEDSTLEELTTVILAHGLSSQLSIEPTYQFVF